MTHVDIRWRPAPALGLDLLVAEVRVGPSPAHLRVVGELQLHACELNALDRVLRVGATFEHPATTYAIRNEEEALAAR